MSTESTPPAAPPSRRAPVSPSSRRRWRRWYRRLRVYVPLAVVLLLGMLLVLPLSPEWLRARVEREAITATGLPLRVERLRLRIATGELEIQGLALEPDGAEPFRIGRVRLSGDPGELIAGDGRWPDEVFIHDVPELRATLGPAGVEVEGPWRTLLDALAPADAGDEAPVAPGDSGAGRVLRAPGHSPAVYLRNARARVDAREVIGEVVTITAPTVSLRAREGATDPFSVSLEGSVLARATEQYSATAEWHPVDKRLKVLASLSGFTAAFPAPLAGTLVHEVEDARLDFLAAIDPATEDLVARAELQLGRSSLEQAEIGGEGWIEEDLALRLSARLPEGRQVLEGISVRLEGAEIGIDASGSVGLEPPMQSDLRARVHRLPAGALELLQRQAVRGGVRVERLEDALLTADARITGPLLQPAQWQAQGTATLERWRMRPAGWPAGVVVQLAQARVDGATLLLDRLSADYEGVRVEIGGAAPVLLWGEREGTASLGVSAQGPTGPLLRLLEAQGLRLDPLESADFEFDLATTIEAGVASREGRLVVDPPRQDEGWTARLSWQPGELRLRGLDGPVSVAAGAIAMDPALAAIPRTRVEHGGVWLEIGGQATTSEEERWLGAVRVDLSGRVGGALQDGTRLLGAHVPVPLALAEATGEVAAEFAASGLLDPAEAAPGRVHALHGLKYDARVQVSGASGEIPLPDSILAIESVDATIHATHEAISLRDARLRPAVGGDLRLEGSATAGALTARVHGTAPIAIARVISPRDLRDLAGEGTVDVDATGRLLPAEELPEAEDIARRWLAALAGPEARKVGVLDGAPLRLDIEGTLTPHPGASFLHRDMPHRLHTISGVVGVDETGFQPRDMTAHWGEPDGPHGVVRIPQMRVTLGHLGPVAVDIEMAADEFDINAWMKGWGQQPWAERPDNAPRRRPPSAPAAGEAPAPPRLMARITTRAHLGRTQFLSLDIDSAEVAFEYEAWRRAPNLIRIPSAFAHVYGGKASAQAELTFRPGELTELVASASAENADLKRYLDDLLDGDVVTQGRFTGNGNLRARLGDYSTWVGDGSFTLKESNFIGTQAFRRLTQTINLATMGAQTPTTVRGTAIIGNEQVRLPDIVAQNEDIRMVADGIVGFYADLDFLLTVRVLSETTRNIPILGRLNDAFQNLANRFFTLEVRGRIKEPVVSTRPTALDPFGLLGKTPELAAPGEDAGALGRPLDIRILNPSPPPAAP